jgi:hypothetical protein
MAVATHGIAVLCATLAFGCIPAKAQTPESVLLEAMQWNAATRERVAKSEKAILAYVRAGLVSLKPDRRIDYTDYRLLQRPATLFGLPLVALEEEYFKGFIGCCVSPGVGAIVEASGSSSAMRSFAQANQCSIDEPIDQADLHIRRSRGPFLEISCRERDVKN